MKSIRLAMKKSGRLLAAALVVALVIGSPAAEAIVITTGCGDEQSNFGTACGLDELMINDGTITINDKRFSSFTLLDNPTRQITLEAEIPFLRIDPIDSLLNPGITVVDTGDVLRRTGSELPFDGSFQFLVEVLGGALRIIDNELIVAIGDIVVDVEGGFPLASVVEDALSGLDLVAQKTVFCFEEACANSTLSDRREFQGQSALAIDAQIFAGGFLPGDLAEIDAVTLRFSQIPEPGTALLLLSALAGLLAASARAAGTVSDCQGRIRTLTQLTEGVGKRRTSSIGSSSPTRSPSRRITTACSAR